MDPNAQLESEAQLIDGAHFLLTSHTEPGLQSVSTAQVAPAPQIPFGQGMHRVVAVSIGPSYPVQT
ncbi:Uncharacterised protein [uncultured archaeon]|nr:Uncharacterised protein [uncultured archaeon]